MKRRNRSWVIRCCLIFMAARESCLAFRYFVFLMLDCRFFVREGAVRFDGWFCSWGTAEVVCFFEGRKAQGPEEVQFPTVPVVLMTPQFSYSCLQIPLRPRAEQPLRRCRGGGRGQLYIVLSL